MKLIIDIPDEEYKTLSELSEKEKVNELSRYERVIANGIPYEDRTQGEWIHYLGCGIGKAVCSECGQVGETKKYCGNCGAKMKGGAENA